MCMTDIQQKANDDTLTDKYHLSDLCKKDIM